MKKIYIVIVLALALLSGCNKSEYSKWTVIQYGNAYFEINNVATLQETASVNVLKLSGGDLNEYNNPDIKQAFYTCLTFCFESDDRSEWEGEYRIAPYATSSMDYMVKYIDNNMQPAGDQFTHSLTTGTLKLTHLNDNIYEIEIEAYTSQMLSLKAYYNGTLRITPLE